jgi:hypothetical protein
LELAVDDRDDAGLHERVHVAAAELNWPHERARLTGLYDAFGKGGRRNP